MHFVQARLMLVVSVFASVALVPPDSDANGTKPMELKILAQRSFISADPSISFVRLPDKPVEPLVIRNVEELVVVSRIGRAAKDPAIAKKNLAFQKEAQEAIEKFLKVEKIDWEKQMVIAVTEKQAFRVPPKWEIASVTVNGETAMVQVSTKNGDSYGAYGSPAVVMLVERFNGKVDFKWSVAK